jgi:hypothetical protein
MRTNANALKHIHIRVPSIADAKGWVARAFTKERTANAGLILASAFLYGWLFFVLYKPFLSAKIAP